MHPWMMREDLSVNCKIGGKNDNYIMCKEMFQISFHTSDLEIYTMLHTLANSLRPFMTR